MPYLSNENDPGIDFFLSHICILKSLTYQRHIKIVSSDKRQNHVMVIHFISEDFIAEHLVVFL